MVECHGVADMAWSLKQRGSGAMTGAGAVRGGHRRKSWRRLASGQRCRYRCLDHDGDSRNANLGVEARRDVRWSLGGRDYAERRMIGLI